MAKSDMTGVFVCGTTGESQSLTTNERKNILEQWVKSSNGRFKVIVHVGSNSQVEAIELARHAAETGADANLPQWHLVSSSRKTVKDFN